MEEKRIIDQLSFTDQSTKEIEGFPPLLKLALSYIENFLNGSGSKTKLCIVLPAKSFAAQWLAIPLTLDRLQKNFRIYNSEIYRSHEHYHIGDRLILNNSAIVAWAGRNERGICFRTKREKNIDGPEITVKFDNIAKLKPAPPSRKALSTFKNVIAALPSTNNLPADKLLGINSQGNDRFNKKSICLAGKFKTYEAATDQLVINEALVSSYFTAGRIGTGHTPTGSSPLLLTNDITNLTTFNELSERVSLLVADGAEIITNNITNFLDIADKGVPAVVVTDLSESEHFPIIADLGFKVIDLTAEGLVETKSQLHPGPFFSLNTQLDIYSRFSVAVEYCENTALEELVSRVSAINNDESNNDLSILRSMLVNLFNYVAELSHNLSDVEKQQLRTRTNSIIELYGKSRNWLGASTEAAEVAIEALKIVTTELEFNPPTKYLRLLALLSRQEYDYIICSTPTERAAIESMLNGAICLLRPFVIVVEDIDKQVPHGRPVKALVVSWLRIRRMTMLMNCFRFTQLTMLFYGFEASFFRSLNRRFSERAASLSLISRNRSFINWIKAERIFADKVVDESLFRIAETGITSSKNTITGQTTEIIQAKAILFDNDQSFFAAKSHKFYILSETEQSGNSNILLQSRRTDDLMPLDLVALISTQRDMLIEFIEKTTEPDELKRVKYWTGLWKKVLLEYYNESGGDFIGLVNKLHKIGCKRHKETIRFWLQDENLIGPNDDSDLISIAIATGSELLYENIDQIRACISTMTGWRIRAAEQIVLQMRQQLQDSLVDGIDVGCASGCKIAVQGLGTVILLRISHIEDFYQPQDARFVNRILTQVEI